MSKILERLQNTEASTKQWLVVGASALAGLLVVWIWLGYFNNIVAPAPVAATGTDSSISFAESAKGSFALVSSAIVDALKHLKELVLAPRSITIQPNP